MVGTKTKKLKEVGRAQYYVYLTVSPNQCSGMLYLLKEPITNVLAIWFAV